MFYRAFLAPSWLVADVRAAASCIDAGVLMVYHKVEKSNLKVNSDNVRPAPPLASIPPGVETHGKNCCEMELERSSRCRIHTDAASAWTIDASQ
jgi:hypothetical protein